MRKATFEPIHRQATFEPVIRKVTIESVRIRTDHYFVSPYQVVLENKERDS